MLHEVTIRTLVLAACGWLLAGNASALSLGQAHGAVLVGRPLDLAIPVTLDAKDADAPCPNADVFYGEQKVARPPTVRWEPAAGGEEGVVRITSPVLVDEPMVTVYLRMGCTQPVTRRFVLLSEVPPAADPAMPWVPAVPAAPPPARAPLPAPRPPRTAAAGAPPAPAAATRAPSTAPAPAQRAERAPSRTRAARQATRASQPRLEVEPLDLTIDRSPTLRLSSELQVPAATDPQARLNAAALWAALQRSPEQVLQDGQRQVALERDIQALRAQTQQNATAVGEMRAQVARARSERQQASSLVWVLLAALAALTAWMLWQWRRASRMANVERWFETPHDSVHATVPAAAPPAPGAAKVAAAATAASVAPAAVAATLAQAGASGWGQLPQAQFQASQGGTLRMVGVQELIDVHDKAQFFLALGQQDQAIASLEAHVHDQVETSALAWMDLLELYHQLGKRVEYERLRAEFRERFAVQVPDFEHFDQPTSSLENYGRALSRIVALWPSQRVLNVIEESIFRKPGLPGAEPFSLEAYRELVLLYHIAKDVAPEDDSVSAPLEYRATDFPATSLQPLNSLDLPERPSAAAPLTRSSAPAVSAPVDVPPAVDVTLPAAEPVPPPAVAEPSPEATVVMGRVDEAAEIADERERLMMPPSSPRIGLDIDLDTPAGAPESAPRELPPLDFDTGAHDHWNTQDPNEPQR